MVNIYALVAECEETMDIVLFWRLADVAKILPDIIRETFPEDVNTAEKAIERIQAESVEKALAYLNRHTDWDFTLEEVPVEGALDARLLKKLEAETEFDGPKLKVVRELRKTPHKESCKIAAGCSCVTVIDGVQV